MPGVGEVPRSTLAGPILDDTSAAPTTGKPGGGHAGASPKAPNISTPCQDKPGMGEVLWEALGSSAQAGKLAKVFSHVAKGGRPSSP